MRKSRFTEAQILGMIKEQEAGMPTAEPRRVCRRLICLSYAAMSDLSRAA